ncbi:MAG TPA: two-component regulator propeller domain-containing protein [Sphingobacteriaceae bacterium]
MKPVSVIRACLPLLICFLTLNSAAFEILFSRYSVNDGLASNFVNCVWQDPRGLIWIGTENGLQRYDGSKFIDFYKNSNQQKLPALAVNQIMDDARGNMWVRMGARIGIFNRFDYTFKEARVLTKKALPTRPDYYLRLDYKGNLLLTIKKRGMLVYNPAKHAFEENRKVIYVPEDYGINHAWEDKETGNSWLSTDKGLFFYNYRYKKIQPLAETKLGRAFKKLPYPTNVTHMHIDRERRYWIVSWDSGRLKTHCFNEKTGELTSDIKGLTSDDGYFEIHNFKESRGILWAYGLHFLKIYDPGLRQFYKFYSEHPSFGIRFNTIKHIFEDKEKNVWISTDNGIYVGNVINDQSRHGTIRKAHHEDAIQSVLETSNSRLLIGTWGASITSIKMNGTVLTEDKKLRDAIYRNMPDGPFNMVWDMHQHSKSEKVWITCQEGRLILHDIREKRSDFLMPDVFEKKTIRQVTEDQNGSLWFGTQAGKLVKLPYRQKARDQNFQAVLNLQSTILKLYIDRNGTLWVTTDSKGLFAIDTRTGKILRNYTVNNRKGYSLSDNSVKDIIQFNDSLYYVAATNLNILNIKTGKIREISVYDGLPFTNVTALQLDNSGDLWLSTIGGICTYDYIRNTFRLYDQKDGLITTTSSDNLMQTSMKLKGNRLIFAGGNHFVIFDPELIKDKKKPANVTITDFKLHNNNLPVDSILKLKKLELTHRQNSITIEFASLNYSHHNKLKYYHMLEGVDENWVKTNGPIAANYSYLPPGEYVFKVRAVNSEGISSSSITSLFIHIKPAFWQRWWFLGLIVISAAGLVYYINNQRLRRLLEVQKIREKVARDLHDDMGSTLSTINILGEMVKMKVNGDNHTVNEYLTKITDNSSRMMEAMDDIVWSIKPSNDSIQKITARMREFASTILEPKDIDYTFVIDEKIKDLVINMQIRRDLFLIFKEAVNNLAKYSKASAASINFGVKNKKLYLVIQDNGIGFDPRKDPGGNGLINMSKRAQMLGGSLIIESAPGRGTSIVLEVPVT